MNTDAKMRRMAPLDAPTDLKPNAVRDISGPSVAGGSCSRRPAVRRLATSDGGGYDNAIIRCGA